VTRAKRTRATAPGAAVTLTENQRQILLQLFAGNRVTEIAAATGRQPSTIANTIHVVRRMMGARTDVDLFRECLRRQLVALEEILALADALRHAHETLADASEHGAASEDREHDAQPDARERGGNPDDREHDTKPDAAERE
jgi:DNA-binding CsgD family transcriptional regulator